MKMFTILEYIELIMQKMSQTGDDSIFANSSSSTT